MELLKSEGLIITCSTGQSSNTAISVIRLSGFNDINDLIKFFSIDKFKNRYSHFCKLIFDDIVIDEIIAVYFKSPNSFTGENVLELSVHGNRLNVERIINLFIKHANFKHAIPGEFTYRALKNNKLNLSQVEGLDLLLNANSNFLLEQGFSLLSGSLQDDYLKLQDAYIKHLSSIEMSIDFMEDVGEDNANKLLFDSLSDLEKILKSLMAKVNRQNSNLLKPEIVIFGDPNSGKSSLFNNLLSEDRSIITNIKGTTRDFISEDFRLNDVFYSLIDTAGIRDTEDEVEKHGVNRSLKKIDTAFFRILCINPNDYDPIKLIDYINLKPDLIIFTHKGSTSLDKDKLFNKIIGPIEPKLESGSIGAETSLLSIDNINFIESDSTSISEAISSKFNYLSDKSPIVLERHKDILQNIQNLFIPYTKLLKEESDISIISSEFTSIGNCISELIGIVSPNDVLHNIFDNFCIGK
jgi:tRNA modification GTPase